MTRTRNEHTGQTDTTAHTPTPCASRPWRVKSTRGEACSDIIAANGELLARMYTGDATYTVRAVNTHAGLVEALREHEAIETWIEERAYTTRDSVRMTKAIAKTRAILALVDAS